MKRGFKDDNFRANVPPDHLKKEGPMKGDQGYKNCLIRHNPNDPLHTLWNLLGGTA